MWTRVHLKCEITPLGCSWISLWKFRAHQGGGVKYTRPKWQLYPSKRRFSRLALRNSVVRGARENISGEFHFQIFGRLALVRTMHTRLCYMRSLHNTDLTACIMPISKWCCLCSRISRAIGRFSWWFFVECLKGGLLASYKAVSIYFL